MRLFAVLAVLLFSSLVLAAPGLDPKSVGASRLQVMLNWDVDFGGERPLSASFTSFAFVNDSRQFASFSSPTPFTVKSDDFGNVLVEFQLDPSKQVQRVSLFSTVVVDGQNVPGEADSDVSRFMQPSQFVTVTPEIQAKALEVAGGERDALRVATKFTSWVHNYVSYDLTYRDSTLNSREVFNLKRGVCDEYSHLLIALLRGLNIPARLATGLVFSGEAWEPHAWVEVAYNGKWYPFDPTYNEGVILDATHLKFASAIDQAQVTEQFSATGNVDIGKVSLNRSESVEILQADNFSISPILQADFGTGVLASGSIHVIAINITSVSAFAAAYPVSLNLPREVNVISQQNQLAFLLPGEKKTISWTMHIPDNLSRGFVYTYPVEVKSLSSIVNGTLTAENGVPNSVPFLVITNIFAQENKLNFTVQNAGNADLENADVRLQFENYSRTFNFSIIKGETKILEFDLSELSTRTRERPIQANLTFNNSKFTLIQPFTLFESGAIQPLDPITQLTDERTNSLPADFIALLAIGLILLLLIIFFAIRR